MILIIINVSYFSVFTLFALFTNIILTLLLLVFCHCCSTYVKHCFVVMGKHYQEGGQATHLEFGLERCESFFSIILVLTIINGISDVTGISATTADVVCCVN